MTNSDHSPKLASLVRRPGLAAGFAAASGGALLLGSYLVGAGLLGFALAGIGAVCIVAGTLTAIILVLGRVLGLESRSDGVVQQGRDRILFPGGKGDVRISSRAFRDQGGSVDTAVDAAQGTLTGDAGRR